MGSSSVAPLALVTPVEGGPKLAILSIEDMIADRMGQYASGTARDMLGQARALYSLPIRFDLDYLDRRIREESVGDYGIEDLEA